MDNPTVKRINAIGNLLNPGETATVILRQAEYGPDISTTEMIANDTELKFEWYSTTAMVEYRRDPSNFKIVDGRVLHFHGAYTEGQYVGKVLTDEALMAQARSDDAKEWYGAEHAQDDEFIGDEYAVTLDAAMMAQLDAQRQADLEEAEYKAAIAGLNYNLQGC